MFELQPLLKHYIILISLHSHFKLVLKIPSKFKSGKVMYFGIKNV